MGVDARMLVRLAEPADDAVLIDASYRLAEACGKYRTFLMSNDEDLQRGEFRRALNRLSDDNEDFDYRAGGIAERDGRWLYVSLWGRYYGIGYERGDLWCFVSIAEWLERNFRGCLVFYGGDSGETLDIFNAPARQRLIQHWAEKGGRPYYASEGKNYRWSDPPLGLTNPICPLCQRPATQYGSGGLFASWTCDGCSRHWVWIGKDVRAYPPSEEFDSFKAAQAQREEEEIPA